MNFKKMVLTIMLLGIYLFPIRTDAEIKEVWDKSLNLSDSVSASILKVDDGVILMQYEGAASKNNVLKKYDLDGNLVKTISNEYGSDFYEITDGFLMLNKASTYYSGVSENYVEIIKYDNDLNQVWKKKYTQKDELYRSLLINEDIVETDDGYIFIRYDSYDSTALINKLDKNGNFILSKSLEELGLHYPLISTYSEGKFVVLDSFMALDDCLLKLNFLVFDNNLNLLEQSTIKSMDYDKCFTGDSYKFKEIYQMNNILKISTGYLVTGEKTLLLDEHGKIFSEKALELVDAAVIDNNIYAIRVSTTNINTSYFSKLGTFLVKYNLELEEQEIQELPLQFLWENPGTGVSTLKNTSVFYSQNNFVNVVFLNANWKNIFDPYSYENLTLRYSLQKYSFGVFDYDDNSSDEVTGDDSGVINNIFKNPETNSVITVIVFCIVVLFGGGLFFYYCVKKKRANN